MGGAPERHNNPLAAIVCFGWAVVLGLTAWGLFDRRQQAWAVLTIVFATFLIIGGVAFSSPRLMARLMRLTRGRR